MWDGQARRRKDSKRFLQQDADAVESADEDEGEKYQQPCCPDVDDWDSDSDASIENLGDELETDLPAWMENTDTPYYSAGNEAATRTRQVKKKKKHHRPTVLSPDH